MNSNTGEIRDFASTLAAAQAGFDIQLNKTSAAAMAKLTPIERIETVRSIRESCGTCGSACPSIKDRFKKRRK